MGRWHRQILPRMPFSRRQLCQRRRRNRQRQTEGTPAYRPRKPGPRRLNDTAELTEDAAGAHARRAAAAPLACQKPWKRACLPYGINGWKRF